MNVCKVHILCKQISLLFCDWIILTWDKKNIPDSLIVQGFNLVHKSFSWYLIHSYECTCISFTLLCKCQRAGLFAFIKIHILCRECRTMSSSAVVFVHHDMYYLVVSIYIIMRHAWYGEWGRRIGNVNGSMRSRRGHGYGTCMYMYNKFDKCVLCSKFI